MGINLGSIVKYANAAYAGLMIGLAVYFAILIKHGYTFVSSGIISVSQLFKMGALGPLVLGVIPEIIVVMIIATVFIVIINMAYENSLRSVKSEREVARREVKGKGRGRR